MKFAITVDGASKDAIPTEPKDKSKNTYYEVKADCDDGITAEWDYNAWNLKVENINKGTKCKLAFNSTLSETDYKNYIEAGVAYRRNTYRGKDITSKLEDGSLFSEIESGHFDDIFVGDYIVSPTSKKTSNLKDVNNQTVVWLIADLDNYLQTGQGDNILKKHHLTIIPAVPLMNAPMNSTDSTAGGYAGSEMVKTTLTTVLNKYIDPDFSTHVIKYSNMLTTNVDSTRINKFGVTSGEHMGASSGYGMVTGRQLDLMSEMNVYGGTVWSSSGYDTGIDNHQYAIFKLKPEYINGYKNKTFNYWLKDVADSKRYANVAYDGRACFSYSGASSDSLGIRPRFLIG